MDCDLGSCSAMRSSSMSAILRRDEQPEGLTGGVMQLDTVVIHGSECRANVVAEDVPPDVHGGSSSDLNQRH
uniref:Uncharacterized protein n=1 Tax=Romanomermis culicivorax TaxID=13658 RepID=A0A915JHH1_ROMCU